MYGLLHGVRAGPCAGREASLLQVEEEVIFCGGGVSKRLQVVGKSLWILRVVVSNNR
jgi:hypothetical protein